MEGGFGLALCDPGNWANLDLVVILEIVTSGVQVSWEVSIRLTDNQIVKQP